MALAKSKIASHRYRVAYPAQFLVQHGIHSDIYLLDKDQPLPAIQNYQLILFSKITSANWPENFNPVATKALEIAQLAKNAGVPILVDICDLHSASSDPRGKILSILSTQFSSQITCPSERMAKVFTQQSPTTSRIDVIADPIESERRQPNMPWHSCYNSSWWKIAYATLKHRLGLTHLKEVRLLWYGHPRNFNSLIGHLHDLRKLGRRYPIQLTICTMGTNDVIDTINEAQIAFGRDIGIHYVQWNMDTFANCLAASDIIILPVNPQDPEKQLAGNIRLTEAVWSGKFVVANPLESYIEFSDSVSLVGRISDGIKWALFHPKEAMKKIECGQSKIAAQYHLEAIGTKWKSVIEHWLRQHTT